MENREENHKRTVMEEYLRRSSIAGAYLRGEISREEMEEEEGVFFTPPPPSFDLF